MPLARSSEATDRCKDGQQLSHLRTRHSATKRYKSTYIWAPFEHSSTYATLPSEAVLQSDVEYYRYQMRAIPAKQDALRRHGNAVHVVFNVSLLRHDRHESQQNRVATTLHPNQSRAKQQHARSYTINLVLLKNQ